MRRSGVRSSSSPPKIDAQPFSVGRFLLWISHTARAFAPFCVCHTHTIQQRWFLQHTRKIARQQHRRTPGITEPPHAVTEVIDSIAAFDAEREAQLRAQPVLVQDQRRTIGGFDGHRPAVRAPARPPAATITPHLRPMLLAVRTKHEGLIHRRRLDRLAEDGHCPAAQGAVHAGNEHALQNRLGPALSATLVQCRQTTHAHHRRHDAQARACRFRRAQVW